jgi:hypothetical protein
VRARKPTVPRRHCTSPRHWHAPSWPALPDKSEVRISSSTRIKIGCFSSSPTEPIGLALALHPTAPHGE